MTPNDPGRRSSCRICDLDQRIRAFLRSSSTPSEPDSIPVTLLSTFRSQRTVAAPNSPEPRNLRNSIKSMFPLPLFDPKSASLNAPRALQSIDDRYPGPATRRSDPRTVAKARLLLVTTGPQSRTRPEVRAEPGCEHRNWNTIYLREPRPFNHPFFHRRTTGVSNSGMGRWREFMGTRFVSRKPVRM